MVAVWIGAEAKLGTNYRREDENQRVDRKKLVHSIINSNIPIYSPDSRTLRCDEKK